ncbi:protein trapped in endoderm-1-like [Palaemon carinicauda]|uniref:protein trapped in endoderm-1-like n=1 Tax=Palaemon carinicauda TaxID=392227 RepID=UPI0035B68E58
MDNSSFGVNHNTVNEPWILASQIWAGIIAVTGTLGNIMTITILVKNMNLSRMERTLPLLSFQSLIPLDGYHLLLLQLCVCDLLYCAVSLPITIYTYSYAYTENESPSEIFCNVAAYLRYSIAFLDWTSLALIAIQRCVDLQRSKGQHIFQPKITLVLILTIWVISFVPHMIYLFKDGLCIYDEESHKCDLKRDLRYIFYSLESLLPCVLIIFGYCSIFYRIWSRLRCLRKRGLSEEFINRRYKEMMRAVSLALALLLLFLICVVPICLYETVINVTEVPPGKYGIFFHMVYWSMYSLNVHLYSFRNKNFKEAYKNFIVGLITQEND